MPKAVNLIFPHQLFAESPLLHNGHVVYLIEEFIFFRQYRFHKQKLAFHRAAMKYYQYYLEERGVIVHYIDTNNVLSDIRQFHLEIARNKISTMIYIDPTDDRLKHRIELVASGCTLRVFPNLQFLNREDEFCLLYTSDAADE